MTKRRCKSKTKAGKPCRSTSLIGDYCYAHQQGDAGSSKHLIPGPHPGAGRPPLPTPRARMRERIEAEIDAVLAPYFDAVNNAVLSANHQGEVIMSEHPDLAARIAAAERLLDRVYGKPAQAVELTGSEGGAVAVEVIAVDGFDAGTRQLAHDLLARAAGRGGKTD